MTAHTPEQIAQSFAPRWTRAGYTEEEAQDVAAAITEAIYQDRSANATLSDDRVEEIAKRWYENAPGLDFTRGWDGAPDDVQAERRSMVRAILEATR